MLKGRKRIEVNKALQRLPPGLEGMYQRVLANVEESRRQIVFHILQWVSVAQRPLTIGELALALSIAPTGGQTPLQILADYISFCGNLLLVRQPLAASGVIPLDQVTVTG